ncbi:protein of unknown function [Caballeronia sp. S22]
MGNHTALPDTSPDTAAPLADLSQHTPMMQQYMNVYAAFAHLIIEINALYNAV